MHKVRGKYSSCTCRSSENICSSNGGAQEKGKRGSKQNETQVWHKKWCISEFDLPLKANVLFCRVFFESPPVSDQTQGFGAVFS
jgi:hypothetical protein